MRNDDKLINGIKAGLAGSLVKDALSGILELLMLRPTFWDFGEYLAFQNIHISSGTIIVGISMEFLFGLFLAVIYAYLKNSMKTNHPLVRGCGFGVSIWFISRCLFSIARIKVLLPHGIMIVPLNMMIAALYGLIVSYVLEKLERRGF